jgi:hypothetical protein
MTERFASEIAMMESALQAGRYDDALALLQRMADAGYRNAYSKIGNLYEIGQGGVERDLARAKYWYIRAVDEANDARAALSLARLYFFGELGKPDYEKARWYCELIYENHHPGAQLLLGTMKHKGLGGVIDLDAAEKCYLDAANQGYVYAIRNLGLLYRDKRRFLKSNVLRAKAALLYVWLKLRSPNDIRLSFG